MRDAGAPCMGLGRGGLGPYVRYSDPTDWISPSVAAGVDVVPLRPSLVEVNGFYVHPRIAADYRQLTEPMDFGQEHKPQGRYDTARRTLIRTDKAVGRGSGTIRS